MSPVRSVTYVSGLDPGGDGAPGEIRTPDLQLRRLPLYPAELRARIISLHRGASKRRKTLGAREVEAPQPEDGAQSAFRED